MGEIGGNDYNFWFSARRSREIADKYMPDVVARIGADVQCWDSPTDQSHETRRTHANTKFIAKGIYRALSLFSVF
jgi:hypothetical protein